MISEQDREAIKAELKSEILQELTGDDPHTNSEGGPYNVVREKYKKLLYETFGGYHYDQVWQLIRRLTCYLSGVRYVRQIGPSVEYKAAQYAELLCKLAIDARREGPNLISLSSDGGIIERFFSCPKCGEDLALSDYVWIPVKHRLPTAADANEDGLVLILRAGGAIREADWFYLSKAYERERREENITHWAHMLPKPTRDEEGKRKDGERK